MRGNRRKPYAVRKTIGWEYDKEKDRMVQKTVAIGYAATRAEGLQMLAEYNKNPYDVKQSKITFQEVYNEWSKIKYPTVSKSNVHGYEASYRVCGTLYHKVFVEKKVQIFLVTDRSPSYGYSTIYTSSRFTAACRTPETFGGSFAMIFTETSPSRSPITRFLL